MSSIHMVAVARVPSGFEAKLTAARLGAEGVIFELRGNVDGMYPMGEVEILVPVDEVDRARDILALINDPELDLGADDSAFAAADPSTRRRWSVSESVAAVIVAVVVLVLMAVRMFSLG